MSSKNINKNLGAGRKKKQNFFAEILSDSDLWKA